MPRPRALPITLTRDELALVCEALDSHTYWQLGDPAHRSSGHLLADGSDDSETADEIRKATALQTRLEKLLAQPPSQ